MRCSQYKLCRITDLILQQINVKMVGRERNQQRKRLQNWSHCLQCKHLICILIPRSQEKFETAGKIWSWRIKTSVLIFFICDMILWLCSLKKAFIVERHILKYLLKLWFGSGIYSRWSGDGRLKWEHNWNESTSW